MSEFHVEVIQLEKIGKHPNADSLSISNIHGGYPCIFRTGDFQPGDLAVYVPVDAMVPLADERWAFLRDPDRPTKEYGRIKAKRLRGIFSMGLLTKPNPDWVAGQNVQDLLGIRKYEPEIDKESTKGECESYGFNFPIYTDLEGLRKHKSVLQEGEEVVLTEKIHGANGRLVYWNKEGEPHRLWVGSHRQVKRYDPSNMWWRVAEQYQLEQKLSKRPGVIVYGEVYGQVQDLTYGAGKGELYFGAFDAYDIVGGRYLDYDDFVVLMKDLDIPMVPVLYRGPWKEELMALSNGTTTIAGVSHCREGFVVKPIKERWNHGVGRVVLKLPGEDYLTRKEK